MQYCSRTQNAVELSKDWRGIREVMQRLVAERESYGIICKRQLVCIATNSLWHFGQFFLLRKKISVPKALKGQVSGVTIKTEIIRQNQGPLAAFRTQFQERALQHSGLRNLRKIAAGDHHAPAHLVQHFGGCKLTIESFGSLYLLLKQFCPKFDFASFVLKVLQHRSPWLQQ